MTSTDRQKQDIKIARLEHENHYYKQTEKHRALIVKLLATVSVLSSLVAVIGWLH
ncbi:hypothetical protein [Paraliobacillus ryukyuensis]|uniref:hypothetical protein n=1 Tax=Paraliobacillus ryukyuensis TaxID=200904 RepID=UPI0015C4274A|nr:hypothetical protein [Paraliobacillus ryukyuensis]